MSLVRIRVSLCPIIHIFATLLSPLNKRLI